MSQIHLPLDAPQPDERTSPKQRTWLYLRFKRAVRFPRFPMAEGEVWQCAEEWGTGRAYLEAVQNGDDRFEFAGGQCLVDDVEVVER